MRQARVRVGQQTANQRHGETMNIPIRHPVSVVQGEFKISSDPGLLLSTILGSCVSVCLHDPVAQIGGMNHFLLPFGEGDGTNRPVRYGLFAMEMLINALMKEGAKKSRMQAKLFGGAKISNDFRDIGQSNVAFARDFIATEGIQSLAESLGGGNARRVVYQPATGNARMLLVPSNNVDLNLMRPEVKKAPADDGVELF